MINQNHHKHGTTHPLTIIIVSLKITRLLSIHGGVQLFKFIRKGNVLFLCIFCLMLTACAAQPTPDISQLSTDIAATIYADITATALAQPTATPTLGVTPTPIQLMPTATSIIISTQPVIPTATVSYVPPGSTADNSTWVADVNYPDGSVLGKGEAFTKTWRFKNSGSTTWNSEFSIIYLEGNLLGRNDETTFSLASETAPGKTADISIPFTAPSEPGEYYSIWKLFNPAGQQFGEYATIKIVVK